MEDKIEFKDVVGKRVLIKNVLPSFPSDINLTEAEVIDLSPSGKYVKLKIYRTDGHTFYDWRPVDRWKIVDVLGEAGE
ncbi:MAG: hypothetical protein ACXQT5_01785 [Candidatus Syntropharchaeia archaeon]